MIPVDQIHALTHFQQNPAGCLAQLHATRQPMVLTVDGEAALVLEAVDVFQEHQQRLQAAEAEVAALKRELLHRDVELGITQIRQGQFVSADSVFAELGD
jgi:hypothetical protein